MGRSRFETCVGLLFVVAFLTPTFGEASISPRHSESLRREDARAAKGVFRQPRGGLGAALSLEALESLQRRASLSHDGILHLTYAEFMEEAVLLTPAEKLALKLEVPPLQRLSVAPRGSELKMLPVDQVGGPRLFHLFVLLTLPPDSDTPPPLQGRCMHCETLGKAFRNIAAAFRSAGASSASSLPPDLLPVFFAVCDVVTREGAAVASVYPSLTLPAVLHFGPAFDLHDLTAEDFFRQNVEDPKAPSALLDFLRKRVEGEAFLQRVRDEEIEAAEDEVAWHVHHKSLVQSLEAAGLADKVIFLQPPKGSVLLFLQSAEEADAGERLYKWIVYRSGWVNVPVEDRMALKNGLILLLLKWLPALLPVILYLVYRLLIFARRVPWLIPASAVTLYAICTSGLVYSVVHKATLFAFNPSLGGITFISRSMRSQYLLEGLAMAAASTGVALAGAALLRVGSLGVSGPLPQQEEELAQVADKDKNKKEDEASRSAQEEAGACKQEGACVAGAARPPLNPPTQTRRRFAAALSTFLVFLMVLLAGLVLAAYRFKIPFWMQPTFFPPPDAAKGPLRVDRGNVF